MTLKLIETLKTSIYNPKHTKNTKIHFNFSKKTKKHQSPILFKNIMFKKISVVVCWFLWHYLYFMLRGTQPNYFNCCAQEQF